MSAYGMITQGHTLATLRLQTGVTVLEYGEEDIFPLVDAGLRAANVELGIWLSKWCTFTNQRARHVGQGGQSVDVEELTSTGRAQGETFTGGSLVGFPLRKFGKALGWDRDALRVTRVSEFAGWVKGIISGDKRNVIKRIKRALYGASNYSFFDRLLDGAELKVKALANGDGEEIPLDPNGQVIQGAHTHYLARAGGALAKSDVDRLIGTLTEHYDEGTIYIEIDTAQEAAFRTFTPEFAPYVIAGVHMPETDRYAIGQTLNTMKAKDRAIGTYNGHEVSVRYTAIPSYVTARIEGEGIEPVLAFRVRGVGIDKVGGDLNSLTSAGAVGGDGTGEFGFGDLQLVYDHDDFPLRAREWQREFDVAVNNRWAGAILYTGGTTYTEPAIS